MKLAATLLASVATADAAVHTVTMKHNPEYRMDVHAQAAKLNQRYNQAEKRNGEVVINNYQNASLSKRVPATVAACSLKRACPAPAPIDPLPPSPLRPPPLNDRRPSFTASLPRPRSDL